MTDDRFDDLARAFSAGASRRQVLKLLLASVTTAAVGRLRPSKASALDGPPCGMYQYVCDAPFAKPCCDGLACTSQTGNGPSACCPPESDFFCTPRGCCLEPCPEGYERDLGACDCVRTCASLVTALRACMEGRLLVLGGYSTLPPELVAVLDRVFASLLGACQRRSGVTVATLSRQMAQSFAQTGRSSGPARITGRIFTLLRLAANDCIGDSDRITGTCFTPPIVQFCDPPCGPCETCSIDNVCVSDCDAGEICQDGSCVPGCASGADCDANACEACVDGQCAPQCGAHETCQAGSCVSNECATDGDCDPNNCEACVGGQCVTQCSADASCCPDIAGCCPAGTTCLPSGCCPNASVCADGVTCRPNGACCPDETPCQGSCCPAQFSLCCGNVCCKPEGHCCPAGDCAPPGATCCNGGGYCESGGVCCPNNTCCPSGTSCCVVDGQPSCC